MKKRLIAGIETGGTKIVCAVADAEKPAEILEKTVIPTLDPAETIPRVQDFLVGHHSSAPIRALAVASFGPVDVKETSATYGRLLNTPKISWRGTDVREFARPLEDAAFALMTDVDGALLGESRAGAAQHTAGAVYMTVGTGVGISLLAGADLVKGARRPELGHMTVRRHPDDEFAGTCPTHGDCLEGMASGTAMQGRKASQSEKRSAQLCAYYLGQACSTLALTGIPEVIIVGGGVSTIPGLLEDTSEWMRHFLGDYLEGQDGAGAPTLTRPALGDDSGIIGALSVAHALAGQ